MLVINYTGDRIHFGLAVERARREGIKVGVFCLTESMYSMNGVLHVLPCKYHLKLKVLFSLRLRCSSMARIAP